MLFQSAPLTKARGDNLNTRGTACLTGFNPLPSQKQGETPRRPERLAIEHRFNPLPSQKQGETRADPESLIGADVSIRSPHKSKGRLGNMQGWGGGAECFNPLPSQKQGETPPIRLQCRG